MTVEFITALFYEVDEQLGAIPKHPEAHLWPSEVVTLGLLHALKGVGNRPFYRWFAQFIAICRRSKWSRHFTNSPLLALVAMAGSRAARKISSACSQAFC